MKKLICLVTGASSGIGREISLELSKKAKHIYITSRDVENLEKLHDLIKKNGCDCTIIPLDLGEEYGIENMASEIFKKDGCIDTMILSAGTIDQLSPVDSINLEAFKKIINLNYIANFRMLKNFHPLLKNSKSPRVGIISSINNDSKEQYWGAYQPTMTALNELAITYAKENENLNILVNIYCPYAVNTNLRNIIMPGEDKEKISSPEDMGFKIVKRMFNEKSSGKIIKIK